MDKGKLFIISGPSGSGKDTLLNCFLAEHTDIKLSRSTVTRPMRDGETQDSKYHHVDKAEFMRLLEEDEFLEYNEYCGNYYGTPKSPVLKCLNDGCDMIVEVDVNGAANIRKKMPDAISVFVIPPSFEALKKRLLRRGTESEDQIESRLKEALLEIKRSDEFDFIVCNDDLDTAVRDFESVILSERLKYNRQKDKIERVLNQC
jgi:guanylate kinase